MAAGVNEEAVIKCWDGTPEESRLSVPPTGVGGVGGVRWGSTSDLPWWNPDVLSITCLKIV